MSKKTTGQIYCNIDAVMARDESNQQLPHREINVLIYPDSQWEKTRSGRLNFLDPVLNIIVKFDEDNYYKQEN